MFSSLAESSSPTRLCRVPDETEKAMDILRRIVSAGFHDSELKTESSLDPLRGRGGFSSVNKRHRVADGGTRVFRR